jgi:NADPH:quinone reductase-like Zn-dependent oxidoreductase
VTQALGSNGDVERSEARPPATMKAVFQDSYGTADVLEFGRVDTPVVDDDRMLVRVRAAGTHVGDWHVMTGLPYMIRAMGYGLRGPKARVRGTDFAGTVEAVGENVTAFRPGDEVFGVGQGSFAEYCVARPDRVILKPPDLAFEQAAALPTSGLTALQALRDKANVRPGHKVMVIGAGGGVGSFAVQLAKAFGTHATGVCSTTKVDLVASLGADEVIDYTRKDPVGTGGRYDLIVDTAGGRPLSQLRGALTAGGTLVLVGAEGGGRLIGPIGRSLRAIVLSPFVGQRLPWLVASVRPDDLAVLAGLVVEGKVTPVIDRTYPLAEAPAALAYLGEGHARGKTVITV